jgi:hypothetical protein
MLRNRRKARASRASASAGRGSALLYVLFAVLVIAGYVLFGVQADLALDLATRVQVETPAQARAVAEAGLVDAFAWFRRQPVQPVTTFAPQRDLATFPPTNETDDPAVGLIREYEIAPNLWARYEVRLSVPAEPFADANEDGLHGDSETFTDTNGNGRWDAASETRDISAARGQPGSGSIWVLVSHGMVFTRPRQDLELGEGPNHRLSIARVATEIRRLALTPPAESALCVARGDGVTVGPRVRVWGSGGGGVVYASSTGSPWVDGSAEISGSPSVSAVPDYDGSIDGVFGVSVSALKSMADLSTTDAASVPAPLGDYTLTVIDADAVFTAARPLRGTGVVVVLGDCTIADGSNSFFNGLLWVGGDLTVRAPSYLRGTILVQGRFDARGTGGDYVEVDFDDGILGEILALMGQYRHTKAIHVHDQDQMLRSRSLEE